jgi:long-subunit fatty acid transport protein
MNRHAHQSRYKTLISSLLLAATLGCLMPSSARAGGFTMTVMGGRRTGMLANLARPDDMTALFHNPAGLGHIKRLSLMGDFSLLVGGITSSPQSPDALSIDSEPVIAPFFLVGAGYRVLDFLTVGIAVYPVASASGSYKYQTATGANYENSTKLVFIETSPGVAANFDDIGLRIGAGYRFTAVTLARKIIVDGSPSVDFDMSGFNFLGFRVGAQWTAIKDHLQLGVSYRHKTVTTVKQDEVYVPWPVGCSTPGECKADDGVAEFTLPGRLIFGLRGDYANIGAAVDFEYAFNSQNERTTLSGNRKDNGNPIELDNVFLWDDAITLRVGGEYRIALGKENTIIPRLGFVFDSRTSKKEYPTAFGTPPGPTYTITGGVGFERGPYRANVAYGYRFGSATITPEDLAKGTETCAFCSYEGDYAIQLNGIYVDFSYDFE